MENIHGKVSGFVIISAKFSFMLGLHCPKVFNKQNLGDRYIHCSLLQLQPREIKKPNHSRRQKRAQKSQVLNIRNSIICTK